MPGMDGSAETMQLIQLSFKGMKFALECSKMGIEQLIKLIHLIQDRRIQNLKGDVSFDSLLKRTNVTLNNKFGYDYVFAANMCKADYLGSSIPDEQHVALFIKDYVDDKDGYPELPFTRFYADCIGSGTPIN